MKKFVLFFCAVISLCSFDGFSQSVMSDEESKKFLKWFEEEAVPKVVDELSKLDKFELDILRLAKLYTNNQEKLRGVINKYVNSNLEESDFVDEESLENYQRLLDNLAIIKCMSPLIEDLSCDTARKLLDKSKSPVSKRMLSLMYFLGKGMGHDDKAAKRYYDQLRIEEEGQLDLKDGYIAPGLSVAILNNVKSKNRSMQSELINHTKKLDADDPLGSRQSLLHLKYYLSNRDIQAAAIPLAMYHFELFKKDRSLNVNQKTSFEYALQAARNGSKEAQLILASYYSLNDHANVGYKKDYAAAEWWAIRAKRNGHPDAQRIIDSLKAIKVQTNSAQ